MRTVYKNEMFYIRKKTNKDFVNFYTDEFPLIFEIIYCIYVFTKYSFIY